MIEPILKNSFTFFTLSVFSPYICKLRVKVEAAGIFKNHSSGHIITFSSKEKLLDPPAFSCKKVEYRLILVHTLQSFTKKNSL